MSTRTIKLKLLTQISLVAIATDVRTLGEFKELPEVKKLDLKWNQVKLIDRATKNSIDLDGALLPATDCIIFVTPTKTDSGCSERKDLYAQIATLKQLGVNIPFNATQTKSSVLEAFILSNSTITETESNDACCTTVDMRGESDGLYESTKFADGSILLQRVDVATFQDEDDILEELADFITNDELKEEFEEIVSELN